MPWKYAETGDKEDEEDKKDKESIRFICHHCGEPLPRENASIISDPAFTAIEKSNAVHCFDCARKYHPIASRIESRRRRQNRQGEVMTRAVTKARDTR